MDFERGEEHRHDFAVRQLVEKSREHIDFLFVLFVNLRKASVFRKALWCSGEVWCAPNHVVCD